MWKHLSIDNTNNWIAVIQWPVTQWKLFRQLTSHTVSNYLVSDATAQYYTSYISFYGKSWRLIDIQISNLLNCEYDIREYSTNILSITFYILLRWIRVISALHDVLCFRTQECCYDPYQIHIPVRSLLEMSCRKSSFDMVLETTSPLGKPQSSCFWTMERDYATNIQNKIHRIIFLLR